ncbi:MAG: hypothetical protein ACRBN8_18475 [Nannocystales bacterium]
MIPAVMLAAGFVLTACATESGDDAVENSAELADDLSFEVADLMLLDELADLEDAEPREGAGPSASESTEFNAENSVKAGLQCGFNCPVGEAILYTTCSWSCGSCASPGFDNAAYCSPVPVIASISATPNPVPVPAGSLGQTSVCWDLANLAGRKVWIKVSANGNAKQIFNGERDAGLTCIPAPWIQENGHYVFTVETDRYSNSVIATTTVTGFTAPGTGTGTGTGTGAGTGPGDDCGPGHPALCP